MKAVLDHEAIGEIAYFEKFWSGKKELFIDREPLEKVERRTYEGIVNGKKITAELSGSFFAGTTLKVDGHTVQLTPNLQWYEVFLSVFLATLVILFSSIPQLNAFFPIKTGGWSVAVSVGLAMFNVALMKATRSILLKILITVIMTAFAFGFCYILNL